jgi:NTP pyrophosphatase (non-canonical NTP hydrolase)
LLDLRLLIPILSAVNQERCRQERLKAEGRFKHTPSDPEMHDRDRIAALGEEYGEVCGALLAETGNANDRTNQDLRKELLHVAAVAVAWIEAIDRANGR